MAGVGPAKITAARRSDSAVTRHAPEKEADRKKLDDLIKDYKKLVEDRKKARVELDVVTGPGIEVDLAVARSSQQMWGAWFETVFTFGTVLLCIGLLSVGFTGTGPERWMCLVILAIILMSYFGVRFGLTEPMVQQMR